MPRPDRRPLSVWYQDLIEDFRAWRTWHKARTFNDLLAINTNLLGGRLDQISMFAPAGTREMLTAQLELNRAGVFTCTAQPGGVDNPTFGHPIEHRAAITLIADDNTKDWIEDAIYKRGLHAVSRHDGTGFDFAVFELHNPDHTPEQRQVGIGAIRGIEVTRTGNPQNGWQFVGHLGSQATAAELHRSWPAGPDAMAQLYRGWQVTIYDRAWGDSTLFDTLTEIARERQARDGLIDPPATIDDELTCAGD